jgi:hypothetical protein
MPGVVFNNGSRIDFGSVALTFSPSLPNAGGSVGLGNFNQEAWLVCNFGWTANFETAPR